MSESRANRGKRRHLFGFIRRAAGSEPALQGSPRELTPSDHAHERLERLYEISKCMATFEGVEEGFPRILTLVAGTFPLLSAVLIENRGEGSRTAIWSMPGVSDERISKNVEHARTSYAYLVNRAPSLLAELHAEPVAKASLRGKEFTERTGKEGEGNLLIFPLVVGHFPVFGALQLEGSRPLNEEDLKFANALANLIAVVLDRYRREEKERQLRRNEFDERSTQLTRSRREVSGLEEERDLREKFVSTLSHDLRTPLTAARMSAQLILRQPDMTEPGRALANRVVSNIDRVDRMIRDLLDANRIRAGERLPLEILQCDLRGMASEALAMLATVHGDRFVLRAEAEEIRGYWDCDALRRVLENLVNNAVKYGSLHSPVTCTLTQTEREVRISVHNEGEPIPPQDQADLFQQFKRTRSAQVSGERGWGLGLALVYGIVEAHGGQVWVESAPEKGTTFTVAVPRNSGPLHR